MTQVVSKAQGFADPELDRQAQAHREAVASNPQYARGILEAQENFKANAVRTFNDELANLRRVSVDRDRCQATRDSYERTYARVRSAAERIAAITGTEQRIPAFLPRPTTNVEYVTVGVPGADVGHYNETRGMGPSGKGLPAVGVPGSGDDWLSREEKNGGKKR